MVRNKINIFILAAGLGERLRPVTNHIPKPLIPLAGRPSLQHVLDRIWGLPYEKIGMNTYYKKEVIKEWVSQCPLSSKIELFPEDEILGTGGALKNAESFLSGGAFLVHNSDILSDINLEELLEHHFSSGNLVTLAVHDHPKFNSLVVDDKGMLKGIKRGAFSGQIKAFTGISVYGPEFLGFLPAGTSSVVDAWLKAVNAGEKIGTLDVSGCYWNDIGTPQAYASAVFHKLREEGEAVYVHSSIKECSGVDIQGHVVIEEGCRIEKGVSMKNCIVLPGSNVGARHAVPPHENRIIGPDFTIDLDEQEILSFDNEGRQPIGTGGSDREYFRIKNDNCTSVLVQCKSGDSDLERHLEYTRFFLRHSVPVPGLIEARPESMQALFEDAGDISLYSYLKCPRKEEETERIYKKVMDAMAQIHSVSADDARACPLLSERVFDREYFRWETDYFMERFVKGSRNIKVKDIAGLEKELDALALKADSFPKAVTHRDFQSQNIMVMKGHDIRVIDYQGARIGPPAYDAASMLWDPYHRLEEGMRARLLEHYIEQMRDKKHDSFDEDRFRGTLLTCRLQRHMQALGAYGFLSSVKGKKYFLKYVPECLRLLKEDIALCADEYPSLYQLIMKL